MSSGDGSEPSCSNACCRAGAGADATTACSCSEGCERAAGDGGGEIDAVSACRAASSSAGVVGPCTSSRWMAAAVAAGGAPAWGV